MFIRKSVVHLNHQIEAIMNRTYAIEIIEMVERSTLESNSPLAKEAINYLLRLRGTYRNEDLYRRIEKIK